MSKAFAALWLAAAVMGSPLAALYCDDASPASMACCQDKASECNQPGATDDCCRKVPVGKDAAAGPNQVTAGKPTWASISGLDALVPVVAPIAPPISSLSLPTAAHTGWADLAPPPLSVLRL